MLCVPAGFLHTACMVGMRPWVPCCLAAVLAACSHDGARVASEMGDYHPPGTGPFDARGNYVEDWADKPSRWRGRSVPNPPSQRPARTEPAAKPKPEPQLAANERPPERRSEPARPQPQPTEVVSSPPPKPQPKPVQVKPKKPAPMRVTVQKGDTLYGLARRHKTTVSAIKQANGLKSDVIRIGQKLVIPRY